LWQYPFENWNAQTAGAFEDHKRAYERTRPVFFFTEIETDWDFIVPDDHNNRLNFELKAPTRDPSPVLRKVGLGFVDAFMELMARTRRLRSLWPRRPRPPETPEPR
jgi:hypothetical protein